MKKIGTVKNITIGCDPEFVIEAASREPLDPYILGLNNSLAFGADGHLFELRPGYSHNVFDIINSIREILKEAYENQYGLRCLKWIAGHYALGQAIGGHIHIGNIRVENEPRFTNVLKHFLVDGISEAIDDKRARANRRRGGYGYANSYRIQSGRRLLPYWNSNPTPIIVTRYEYRAPGSFLVSPQVAFLNLTVAKAISMIYCHNSEQIRIEESQTKKYEILKELHILMTTHPAMDKEEDIALGAELVADIIKKPWKIEWTQDFKDNWRIV